MKTLDESMQELIERHGAMECATSFYQHLQASLLGLEGQGGRWASPAQEEHRTVLKALKPIIEG